MWNIALCKCRSKGYYDTAQMEADMRENIHDMAVRFRANNALIAAATLKAQREGMSLSELMRHALRREVRGRA